MGSLSVPDGWAPYRYCVALKPPQYVIDYLLHRPTGYHSPTLGTVGQAHPGPQETTVIHDLGNGRHSGSGVVAALLLVDTDRRRETVYAVAVGFLHLTEKLARVGAEALDVSSLSLCIESVKGQT